MGMAQQQDVFVLWKPMEMDYYHVAERTWELVASDTWFGMIGTGHMLLI